MFAVGVDVSNGRSTIAVLGKAQKVVMKPFEVQHTAEGFAVLIKKLNALDGESRIVMEHTGRYYESFAMSMYRAGFFVSTINPLVIKEFRDGISVRKVKTDSADSMKIARMYPKNCVNEQAGAKESEERRRAVHLIAALCAW